MNEGTAAPRSVTARATVPAPAPAPAIEFTGAPSSRPGPGSRRRRPRWPSFAGAVAALVVAGSVWAAFLGGGTTTLNATMTVLPPAGAAGDAVFSVTADGRCDGAGEYSDIGEGSAVTVSDASGKVAAVGRLAAGSANPGSPSGCTFAFSVPGVPTGPDFVQMEVAHRGRISISAPQAATGTTALTLGG